MALITATMAQRYKLMELLFMAAVLNFIKKADTKTITDQCLTGITRGNQSTSLEDIFHKNFTLHDFNGTWISGHEFMYQCNIFHDIHIFNANTSEAKTIITALDLGESARGTQQITADRKFLIVGYHIRKVHKYSTIAKYAFVNLETTEATDIADGEFLQLVVVAPRGSAYIYVKNNDMYYRESCTTEEKETRLTENGVPSAIYNGVPDWAYENQILLSNSALWFSPDGRKMAYLEIDDTNVQHVEYIYYGRPGVPNWQYSKLISYPYPKAGSKLPKASLIILDLSAFSTLPLHAPVESVSRDYYIASVQWANTYELAVIWVNRVFTLAQLHLYNMESNSNQIIYRYNEPCGWLILHPPVFDRLAERFVVIKSKAQKSETIKYGHLVKYTRMDTIQDICKTEDVLTCGEYEVVNMVGWQFGKNKVFYHASVEKTPSMQHVYSVDVTTKNIVCLSCELKSEEGKKCLYATGHFSKDLSYVAITCHGPDPLYTVIRSTDEDDTSHYLYEENALFRYKFRGKLLPQVVDMEVNVTHDFNAKVRLYLPPSLDTNCPNKYPMIVYTYACPGYSIILDTFKFDFSNYLTTSRNVIYAMIDGRGSSRKGHALMYAVYRRLGTVEVFDQINVTKALINQLPYIDKEKVGIWGGGYGGYASSMAVAEDHDKVFNCTVAATPVASWLYYAAPFSERVMGMPTLLDNWRGYTDGDITAKAEKFKGRRYFIMHGTADDNVFYQHTMMLVKSLEYAHVMFNQLSFPDEGHSFNKFMKYYSLSAIDQFYGDCFYGTRRVDW